MAAAAVGAVVRDIAAAEIEGPRNSHVVRVPCPWQQCDGLLCSAQVHAVYTNAGSEHGFSLDHTGDDDLNRAREIARVALGAAEPARRTCHEQSRYRDQQR